MNNRLPPPDDDPDLAPHDDDDAAPNLDDECWDALTPDDDYEPVPEPGDFWTDQDPSRPRGSF